MAKFNASKLKILVGMIAINNLTDCEMTVDGETIDVTTKDSAGWAEFLPGVKNWTMSGSGILDFSAYEGPKEIFNDLVNGAIATVRFSTSITGDTQFAGSGIYTNLGITAGLEDKVDFSFSIQGTGPLLMSTI